MGWGGTKRGQCPSITYVCVFQKSQIASPLLVLSPCLLTDGQADQTLIMNSQLMLKLMHAQNSEALGAQQSAQGYGQHNPGSSFPAPLSDALSLEMGVGGGIYFESIFEV